MFGSQELLVILVIALFLFGGKKLPEVGAGLGKGLRAFKKGLHDLDEEIDTKKIVEEMPGVKDVREIKKEMKS